MEWVAGLLRNTHKTTAEVLKRLDQGDSYDAIREELGISKGRISQIKG